MIIYNSVPIIISLFFSGSKNNTGIITYDILYFINVKGAGMVADHLIPIITDAYLKGFRDYDVEFIYNAMVKKALESNLPQLITITSDARLITFASTWKKMSPFAN